MHMAIVVLPLSVLLVLEPKLARVLSRGPDQVVVLHACENEDVPRPAWMDCGICDARSLQLATRFAALPLSFQLQIGAESQLNVEAERLGRARYRRLRQDRPHAL